MWLSLRSQTPGAEADCLPLVGPESQVEERAGRNTLQLIVQMSSGRLFLDRVGRHQSPSPLRRHAQAITQVIQAISKPECSTLLKTGSFYFALTAEHPRVRSIAATVWLECADSRLDRFSRSDCVRRGTHGPLAWHAFVNDRYHFLRLSPGAKITSVKEDERYFLHFSKLDLPATSAEERASEQWKIVARLERLMAFLDRNAVRPRLMVSCRSRRSGYTPEHHCDFIKKGSVASANEALWLRASQDR